MADLKSGMDSPDDTQDEAADPLAGVAEISPNKRYIRFDELVSKTMDGIKLSYKAFDTKNGIEVEWNYINLNALKESEQSRVTQASRRFDALK
jgi:hypothetical protein